MKKMQQLFAVAVILAMTACEKYPNQPIPANQSKLETRTSVTPIVVGDWTAIGDAASECQRAGDCMGSAYKIDNWLPGGMDGTHSDPNAQPGTPAANEIVITSSDGKTFTWSSDYEVCKVIVKGGTYANIYSYPEGSCGDEGLVAALNPRSGQLFDISHVTFCWSNTLCEAPPAPCYQEETAWAAGTRYVKRGNWATYTTYGGAEMTVPVYAGQTLPAGTAILSAPSAGMVTITINLNPGFIFYYDLSDPNQDYNIKIQDYSRTPPAKNPAPGQFAWKSTALFGSQTATVTVPQAKYYGIHLDVAYETDCN